MMVVRSRGIQLTIVRVPLMRVSDHRLGDYDLELAIRLPFLRPDKIKRLSWEPARAQRGSLSPFVFITGSIRDRVSACNPGIFHD